MSGGSTQSPVAAASLAMFRQLFSWSTALLDSYPKPASMALISKRIFKSIDLQEVVASRRRNFSYLLARLEDTDDLRIIYRTLPEGVCPLGFPVLAGDRDALDRHLTKNGVYSPIHWELPVQVDSGEFSEAWSVSRHILTLPVDQRYAEEDMERVVTLVNSYVGEQVAWPAGR